MWERSLFFDHRAFLSFMWVETVLPLVLVLPKALSIVIGAGFLCEDARDAQLREALGKVALGQVRLRIGISDRLALGHGLLPHT